MQKQSAYTREFHAMTQALAKFRHYLLGHKFVIRTDQKSLKILMDQSLHTPEQQAWLHKFIGYYFTIECKPGKENLAADALSRLFLMAWSEPQNQFLHDLRVELGQNEHMSTIVKQCQHPSNPDPYYSVKEDLLYWKGRLVISSLSSLQDKVLQEYHSSSIGGHAGVARTLARITSHFYWPNMKNDIKQFVQNCSIYQQAKSVNTLPAGLLQPLPIPNEVWEDIAMDFITGLPLSFGYTVIMVVVDRLTKYGHFMALKSDYSSKSVAEVFMANIVKLHGMPKSIVSDRDKVFTSRF